MDMNNREKMVRLKISILMDNLSPQEVRDLYGCDFEFSYDGDMITLLEIWHNPDGEHHYRDKYRREFNVNKSILTIKD
jgi:hypothetical protein